MEEKKLNLVEILKDCPKGTKLWSPIFGEVFLEYIEDDENYPIHTIFYNDDGDRGVDVFMSDGRWKDIKGGECMLFPSKDNRDWSTFKVEKPKWNPETLQPFDTVLVRDDDKDTWVGDFFLSHGKGLTEGIYDCVVCMWRNCIPYNEETKHLLGTTDEAPEFYCV